MARTFEALEKAEKASNAQSHAEVSRIFEPPPVIKQKRLDRNVSVRRTDEYNRLRQNVVAALPRLKTRALLFTGSTDGEGAATILATFGRVLARSGERVLLVDMDLRGPMLHELFGMNRGPGTAQLCSGKGDLVAVMNKTETEGLLVVTAGTPVADPFSLLESAGIEALIASMRREADWVLVTAPPVNAYNDAISLVKKVDGLVLVVEAEQTRWEIARSAKERLDDAEANILGVVLNNRKLHIPAWIYTRL